MRVVPLPRLFVAAGRKAVAPGARRTDAPLRPAMLAGDAARWPTTAPLSSTSSPPATPQAARKSSPNGAPPGRPRPGGNWLSTCPSSSPTACFWPAPVRPSPDGPGDPATPQLERAAIVFAWFGPLAAAADLSQNVSLALVLSGHVVQPWPRISAIAASRPPASRSSPRCSRSPGRTRPEGARSLRPGQPLEQDRERLVGLAGGAARGRSRRCGCWRGGRRSGGRRAPRPGRRVAAAVSSGWEMPRSPAKPQQVAEGAT